MEKHSDLYNLFLRHPHVSTDTRRLAAGSLFFALKGANFDGNQFALQALQQGCAAAVVDDPAVPAQEGVVHVDDVLTALQQLAAEHRRALKTPILQVTGTNGKTTTKELCAAVLQTRHKVLYTEGNLNNHIGVPLTLLRLTPEVDVAVVETGANHPGEIAALSEIVDADCGLITNVGEAHLEGFGSLEGVVQTKTELYRHLRRKSGTHLFVNADNALLTPHAAGMEATTYGLPGHDYDVEGEVVACAPCLRLRWRPRGGAWQEVQTQLIGAYNVNNALAAAAVGLHFGCSPAEVSHALESYIPRNNRSQLVTTERNLLVVDAYNANVSSMHAALESFSLMEHADKMVILGEMRELGAASAEAHQTLLKKLPEVQNLHAVWLVGAEMQRAWDALGGELPGLEVHLYKDVDAVREALAAAPPADRLILIKGSNGNRLFTLPELL